MKKFLMLYKASPATFEQMMKSSTPEQQKQGMDQWMAWSKKAASAIVDMGGPLGKTSRADRGGKATDAKKDLGGFSVMQGESRDAIAALMKDHPHFMMGDTASIEIVEIMPVPGM